MEKESLFWADQLADDIVKRIGKDKGNVKCQQTPSGGKHIGNLNDVARAYFPYKAAKEKCNITFVHTTDDRDPLKDVPKRVPDLKGNWKESKELVDMTPYLGMPLFLVPDPFECCESWSKHFTSVWMEGVYALGMRPELYSVNDLYKQGKFEKYIKITFEKAKEVGKLVSKFQETKGENYIPFDAICPQCKKLANINSFNLETKKVHFICGGKSIKKKKAEGCGFEGEVPWSEGKLQWRFEWPALWGIFNTTYEPFGKDHAEGSWKSGKEIASKIFEIEPPIPFVYEFFLVNGEKMSASKGNVYIVQDMMKILEPEIFLYYYTKRPGKQRDLDLQNINLLVEEFEQMENTYFEGEAKNEKDFENIKRMYELCWGDKTPKEKPIRIPYTFASMIAQTVPKDCFLKKALEILEKTGHVKKLSGEQKKQVEKRLVNAKNWVELYASDRYKFSLRDVFDLMLSEKEKEIIKSFAEKLSEKEYTEDDLYPLFKEISESHGIETKEFFQIIYRVLIGKEFGPRLNTFIIAAGQEKVIEILERSTQN